MLRHLAALLALPLLAAPSCAQEAPSPSAIVADASTGEWVAIAADDLLVMDLVPDRDGKPRRVVIQLMPPPFSQGWVDNIRTLARAHWWDGTSVNRVQDNYVAQWGDATEEKALPAGLTAVPQSEYVQTADSGFAQTRDRLLETAKRRATAELTNARADRREQASRADETTPRVKVRLPAPPLVLIQKDNYANVATFEQGWPIALAKNAMWPVHCYATVGVGRNLSPDTGTGAELYAVIGHAPRHLDRNIAVVGRVVEGIENLSSLPRGKGDLGFYDDPTNRVPITSVRLASELPEGQRPRFEYMNTESPTFARYADARANRRDPFFIVPAGGADICNIPVPVRRVKG